MTKRDWARGDLIAALLFAVAIVALVMLTAWNLPAKAAPQESPQVAYSNASYNCLTQGQQGMKPWDVTTCQWQAYERIYGSTAAVAAWNATMEAR